MSERKDWYANARVYYGREGSMRRGWSQECDWYRFKHEARETFDRLAALDLAEIAETVHLAIFGPDYTPSKAVTHAVITWGSTRREHGEVEVS